MSQTVLFNIDNTTFAALTPTTSSGTQTDSPLVLPFSSSSVSPSNTVAPSNSLSTASSSTSCAMLRVGSIKASSALSTAPPSNAIDNNLNTRWSSSLGAWIQTDIGSRHTICSVDIAWYKGNERVYSFDISVSGNESTFTKVFSGKSSGTTTSFESYTVNTNIGVKFVRITVTGNTANNNAAAITEIHVNGYNSCQNIPVSKVTANGNEDVHPPSDAVDDDLATRWSNLGLGSWIQTDLGSEMTLCSVDIAWYKGNERINTFDISVSGDGSTFTKVFSGKSSGTTTSFEKYNLVSTTPGIPGVRYVRITVTGNTQTDWVSISEIVVAGYSTSSVDKFGIKEIYPTKSGGEEWYMNMQDPIHDSRSDPPSMTKNSDGSWKVTSDKVRYGVFTSSGYHPDKITTLDQKKLETKGYMQSPNDWKNVEMTGQVKFTSGDSSDSWTWYGRGGRHTGDGYPDGCEGTAYKGDLFYKGPVRFAKEQWHVDYVFTGSKSTSASSVGKFVGFKYMMYNLLQNGKTVVKLELWVDPDLKNNWQKVDEFTDTGGFGSDGGECGGAKDQIITWGGPIATFRWDSATNVSIKNLSVREIQPPTQ
jgi:F5/8 type C domain-containing protein